MFVPGGATTQFASVPLNLFNHLNITNDSDSKAAARPTAHYVVTGVWSEKAAEEAAKYVDVVVTATSKSAEGRYQSLPVLPAADADNAALQGPAPLYTYVCSNETVHGVELPLPGASADSAAGTSGAGDYDAYAWIESLARPGSLLVADMSSHFCGAPFDVSRFDVIFAGAQKNIGPAGVTVVIVRKDLLKPGVARADTPVMLSWATAAANGSLYNTPPAGALHATGKVLRWLRGPVGGLARVAAVNAEKAAALYGAIDGSEGFYSAPVQPAARSKMNVVFRIKGGDKVRLRFVRSDLACYALLCLCYVLLVVFYGVSNLPLHSHLHSKLLFLLLSYFLRRRWRPRSCPRPRPRGCWGSTATAPSAGCAPRSTTRSRAPPSRRSLRS